MAQRSLLVQVLVDIAIFLLNTKELCIIHVLRQTPHLVLGALQLLNIPKILLGTVTVHIKVSIVQVILDDPDQKLVPISICKVLHYFS